MKSRYPVMTRMAKYRYCCHRSEESIQVEKQISLAAVIDSRFVLPTMQQLAVRMHQLAESPFSELSESRRSNAPSYSEIHATRLLGS